MPQHPYDHPRMSSVVSRGRGPGRAVAAAGVAATLLLSGCGLIGGPPGPLGGGGGSSTERADPASLPANPKLAKLTFPKPESLGYQQGTAMCTKLSEVMRKRGYIPQQIRKDGRAVQCDWNTPGLSLIKAGSNAMFVRLIVQETDTPEDAEDFMGMRLAGVVKQRKAMDGRGYTTRLEKLPVGEAGYIYHHRKKDRGDTESLSRSGKYLLTLNVFGYSMGEMSGESRAPGTALTEEVTYREITDILKSINGQGGAGASQITKTNLRKTKHFAGLPTPKLPTQGLGGKEAPPDSVQKVCGRFSAATRFPGVKPKITEVDTVGGITTWTCKFDSGAIPSRGVPDGFAIRRYDVYVKEVSLAKSQFAQDYFGNDLQSWLKRSAGGNGNTLLDLPVGPGGGYAGFYADTTTHLQAGFLAGPTTYVKIDMNARTFDRDNGRLGSLGPMPAKTIVTDLAKILKGAGA